MQIFPLSDGPGRNGARLIFVLVALAIATDLWASGWPPFAQRDFAEVVRGGVVEKLTTGADSVLANDVDLEGDNLTAVLDGGVKHGTLEFRDDGTFTYRHDGGKGGSDSFKYRAFDGTGTSRSTRVTIEILDEPNSPPFVIAPVPDQEALAGTAYELQLAGHFDDPDQDDVLTFSARGLPGSRSLSINAASGVLSGTPGNSDVRTSPYSVEITATDRAGATARLTFPLLIFRDNRADMALAVSLAANPITVGQPVLWHIQIENKGPGNLENGQLTANWTTGGASLTLTSPDACLMTGNGTTGPEMTCTVDSLDANTTLMIDVEGTQSDDGDNSLIGVFTSDDPIPENNSDLASAQVVDQFSEGPTQSLGLSGAGVDAGDIDGDGDIDIVATSNETLVFFNNGSRAVTTPGTSLGPDTGGSAVTLLDWDGDGSRDIAVGGLAGHTAEIFVNDRNGGFVSTEQLQGGSVGNVNDIIAVDLNNDGRSELVLTGTSGTVIMQGRGQGGFDQATVSSGAGLDLAATDIDQDGDQDIIVVRSADRAVDLHYNIGDGSSFNLTRLNQGSVATVCAGDLNGDGAADLLLGVDGDDLNAPKNKVLFQQAGDEFSPGGSFGASPVTALLSGDIDLDGWPDVVAVNEAGVHQLYLGSGGGAFALATEQIVSDGMQRGVLTDFNDDDSLDLIMVGRNATALEIHANNGIGRLGLGDRLAPDLRLVGDASTNIPAGQDYVDPGATAVDDIDGDISDQIVVSGTINSTVVGTQSITYSVADRAGNNISAVRTVVVGVNQGRGGSGGGHMAPIFLLVLIFLLVAPRVRNARPSRAG